MVVGSDEMVIELDKGLLNLDLRNSHHFSHQNHKREKHLRHNASESLRKKDSLSPTEW